MSMSANDIFGVDIDVSVCVNLHVDASLNLNLSANVNVDANVMCFRLWLCCCYGHSDGCCYRCLVIVNVVVVVVGCCGMLSLLL